MNAENFAEIIKNPAQLYQVSYHELKSLVLQYPFCRNLHHLLLQKSQMDQHQDFERILEKTASATIDRRHLYHQLHAMQPETELVESFGLEDEYLELLDLKRLDEQPAEELLVVLDEQPVLETEADTPVEAPEFPGALLPEKEEVLDFAGIPADGKDHGPPAPTTMDDDLDFSGILSDNLEHQAPDLIETDEFAGLFDSHASPSTPSATYTFDHSAIISGISSWLAILEHWHPSPPVSETVSSSTVIVTHNEEASETPSPLTAHSKEPNVKLSEKTVPKPAPRPLPKRNFSSWSKRSHLTHLAQGTTAPPPPQKKATSFPAELKEKKKKGDIVRFAEKSLKPHKEVVSVTLAELLVSQERYTRAIEMYKQLILVFPEKSTFFADKIEQLKKYL